MMIDTRFLRPGLNGLFRSLNLTTPLVALLATLSLTGCPQPDNSGGNGAKLTMLLAAENTAFTTTKAVGSKARVVQQSEIESLFVNVDEIKLRRAVENGSELVTVFSDPIQINLLDLVGVNDVLDSAVVPEGTYTEVQMLISTPKLTLASDTSTVLENVTLLDGGNLTVPADFTATNDGTGLLVLQLGSISLVSLDDGSYQLVPDLQVDLFDSSVEAQAIGVISTVDTAGNTFVLKRDTAEITVNFESAHIFKPSDFDTPTGTVADLVVGLKIFASGTLSADGSLLCDLLVLFPESPTHSSHDSFSLILNGVGAEVNAHGSVEYESEGDRQKLKIEAEGLNFSGTIDVLVDGEVVGSVDALSNDSKDDGGNLRFRLDTRLGDMVPALTSESVIELVVSGTSDVLMVSSTSVDGGDDNGGDDNGGDDNGGDDNGGDDNGGDDNGGDGSGGDDNGGDDNGGGDNGGDDNGAGN